MPVTQSHPTITGTELHEDKRIKIPVRAASTANLSLTTPGAAIDGVTLTSGDRVLLKDQSTASQNGVYTWTGAAAALTRATDASAASDFVYGFKVYVREGTANGAKYFTFTTSAAVTVGTTSLTFAAEGGGSGSVTSVALTMPSDFSVAGSPVTGSGTLAVTAANQAANTVKAGPASGSAAAPTYRALAAADLPTMVASGASHAAGAVPDPGSTAGTGKFLREDATWATPSGGSGSGGTGGSIVPIQTQTLTATAASVTFTVPSGFKNLRLSLQARGDSATGTTTNLLMRFNSDPAANYDNSKAGGGATNDTGIIACEMVNANIADANKFTTAVVQINNHGSAIYKEAVSLSFEVANVGSTYFSNYSGGIWLSTAAITTITLIPAAGSLVSNSTFTLWGEADTGPALLTSNSNLISETILTAAQASIPIPNIPQGYRDLRIEIIARDNGSTSLTRLLLQLNGDTTAANYLTESDYASATSAGAQTMSTLAGIYLADVALSTETAGVATAATVVIPSYSQTTFNKTVLAQSGHTDSGTKIVNNTAGVWANTAAITSLTLALSGSDQLAIGTTIRVYGEPAAAAGPSVGTGTKLRISANQSITNSVASTINWDTEDADADNQHFTSSANLTGTVAKTASSNAIVGTGTAFTTELSVGQVISVPGTATEKAVVIAIADATHLTTATNFANTATGQTAARVNSAVVFRQAGMYGVELGAYMAAVATGIVTLQLKLNNTTVIDQVDQTAINAAAGYELSVQRPFAQWDFIEAVLTQTSAGAVNLTADERTHLSIMSRPTVIVAVPYVNVQDQKAQNTSGGTFSSGSWQTRTLNTTVSDTAGVSSLASNRITLPPGWYRCLIRCPAYAVNQHQARLQNITSSTTLLTGTSEYASATGGGATSSVIAGKFQLTASSALEVQHQCATTEGSDGFGRPANFGTEVYTVAEIWREG